MDALSAFRLRYDPLYDFYLALISDRLSPDQLRFQPLPSVNTVAWCLWHIARVEDVGLNRLVTDGKQVFDRGKWGAKLKVSLRHFGTNMTGAQVAELSAAIDLAALREYQAAVRAQTLAIIAGLAPESLAEAPNPTQVDHALLSEGVLLPEAEWVADSYRGQTRGWLLFHTGLTHSFQHVGEMLTLAGFQGVQII